MHPRRYVGSLLWPGRPRLVNHLRLPDSPEKTVRPSKKDDAASFRARCGNTARGRGADAAAPRPRLVGRALRPLAALGARRFPPQGRRLRKRMHPRRHVGSLLWPGRPRLVNHLRLPGSPEKTVRPSRKDDAASFRARCGNTVRGRGADAAAPRPRLVGRALRPLAAPARRGSRYRGQEGRGTAGFPASFTEEDGASSRSRTMPRPSGRGLGIPSWADAEWGCTRSLSCRGWP